MVLGEEDTEPTKSPIHGIRGRCPMVTTNQISAETGERQAKSWLGNRARLFRSNVKTGRMAESDKCLPTRRSGFCRHRMMY